MKILFVFDAFIDTARIKRQFWNPGKDEVLLFPLTSKASVTKNLEDRIKKTGCRAEVLHSAGITASRDEKLRDKYINFISDFPKKAGFRNKNLKEIFSVDKNLSLWWLSLIAEKNVYKSDSFNRLVQLDSIVTVIKDKGVGSIVLGSRSKKLKDAVCEYCRRNNMECRFLPVVPITGLKGALQESQRFPYFKHFIILICSAVHIFLKSCKVKKRIGFMSRPAATKDKDCLMVLTPYPNIDQVSAQKGIFKNNFYVYLQEALESGSKNIIWAAMYARNKNISFSKSLEYAELFIKNGYIFFFLEEFNSLIIQIKAFLKIFRSSIKFLFLQRRIRKASSFEGYNIYSLFKDDWYSSFAGRTGYDGLVYYYMFINMFKKIQPDKCLYPCEMRAWEKALISARNILSGSKTFLLAHQSGTVPKMHLNFFNHPDELKEEAPYPMPQADRIVCNGKLAYEYMAESGWPREKMRIAEALRYMYLKKPLSRKFLPEKEKAIILLFSISPEESGSILSASYEAFKDIKDTEVWIKPHPFLNLDKVFESAGVPRINLPFQIKHDRLEDLLSKARIAVAGESSAAVEALAFGCDVLVVNVPEWINLSPFRFVDTDMVKTVSSSESLLQAARDIFQAEYKEKQCEEKRRIVNDFFYLNQEADIPEKFIKLLKD